LAQTKELFRQKKKKKKKKKRYECKHQHDRGGSSGKKIHRRSDRLLRHAGAMRLVLSFFLVCFFFSFFSLSESARCFFVPGRKREEKATVFFL
jgi:hypothetical protein